MKFYSKKNIFIISAILLSIASGSTTNASFSNIFNNFFGIKNTISESNKDIAISKTTNNSNNSVKTTNTTKSSKIVKKTGVERSALLKVISVSDGDTIKVVENGITKTIRILGIDTPEKFVTRTGYKECYGEEASSYAKNTLLNKNVYIERDLSQDDKDKYSRYLRHVFYEDGSMYQEKAISEGYGFYYFYNKATFYDERLKSAENIAKKNNVGVWLNCNGKREALKK